MLPFLIPLLMHDSATIAVVVYFVFGAVGTLMHLWVSPTLEFGRNRGTVVRAAMGAAVGVVLPFAGDVVGDHVGVPAWVAGELPLLVKGFVIFILSLGGSYVLGDLLARRALAKAGAAVEKEKQP